MSFVGPFDGLLDFLHEVELKIDQSVIDSVMKTLHQNSQDLGESPFPRLHVPESTFGASTHGEQLGFHHLKAHQVITDTLTGVVTDLERFRDGVQKAEKLLSTADEGNASDLAKKKQAVEIVVHASSYAEGDVRNHASRNEHLRGEGGN